MDSTGTPPTPTAGIIPTSMFHAALKQLPWMLALFVLGPIAGHLTGSLRAADGSHDATLLVGLSPAAGVLAGVVTIVFAGIVGVFASHLNGCRSGLNAAGIVVAWAASQTATVDELIRRAASADPLIPMAIEGAVVCVLAVPMAAIVWRAGLGRGVHGSAHPLPDGSPSLKAFILAGPRRGAAIAPEHESLSATLIRAFVRTSSVGAIAATVAAGVLVTYLACQDVLKGQAIFAAALTGIVAVPLGRVAGDALGEQPPLISFVLGFAVLAAAGPMAANFLQGGSIVEDTYAGDLLPLAAPVTLDWLAGACIGIPIGEAWFLSMFKPQSSKA